MRESRGSPETLKSLLLVAKIESSESSNCLEGIELPHKKIKELVLKDAITELISISTD